MLTMAGVGLLLRPRLGMADKPCTDASRLEVTVVWRHPRTLMIAVVVGFEGGLGVLAFALGWLAGINPFATIRFEAWAAAIGVLATAPAAAFFVYAVHSRRPAFVQIRSLLDQVLIPWLALSRPIDLVIIGLAAGIGEELLFRGWVQAYFAQAVGVGPGLVAASLVFGLAHFITPAYFVITTLIGLYLGILWIATGNLIVPIVVHGLYDVFGLLYLVANHGNQARSSASSDEPVAADTHDAQGVFEE